MFTLKIWEISQRRKRHGDGGDIGLHYNLTSW
jgi:hypothetical protein